MTAITDFLQIDFVSFFIEFFTILIGIFSILTILEKASDQLGIEFRWLKRRRKEQEMLLSAIQEISELKKKYEQDFLAMAENFSTLSSQIESMQQHTEERFLLNERNQNRRIRAELKDKISDSYRRYHLLGKISDMEFEALEELIEAYELADGENSFVHSVVQQEMYTWERTESDSPQKKGTNLL